MDELTKRVETLSPAKRALLERRLRTEIRRKAPQPQLTTKERREPARASFAQERLWFLQQLEPKSAAYNVPRAVRILGNLNLKVLEQSVNEIIARHEPLRTRFSLIEGELRQIVTEGSPIQIPVKDLGHLPVEECRVEAKKLSRIEAAIPFDLNCGPMVRASVLRLRAEEHLLLLTMHHIVSDAWSAGIFFQELITLYKAFSENRNSPLPPLKVQYGDYAEWQRDLLQGDVLEEQLSYWRNKLSGAPAALDLPADRPRPAATEGGASCTFSISQSLTEQLRDLSRRAGTTLFMTLLGAFSILLHRYSAEDDIVVGSPIAGRNQAEIEGLIGFFINTLALRIDLRGNPTFETLLTRVKQTAVEAFEYQELPFEKLVEELKPERLNRIPFFQVMFQFQHGPRNSAIIDGLTFTTESVEIDTAKVDLSLGAYERDEALKFQMEYSTDLFDEQTIQSMFSRFEVLLESIVSHPDVSIAGLEIMTAAERTRLLVEWNDTREDFGQYESLQERFERQAAQNPNAVAVIDGNVQITFADLNARANRLAHHLKRSGVGPEVRVAVFVERSLNLIVALFGVLKAGGAYVPLDVAYPQDRIDYLLHDSKPKILLTNEQWQDRLPATDCLIVSLDGDRDKINDEGVANPPVEVTAANAAYVIYTSGSTGKPKGVVGLHGATVNRLQWMYRRYPFAAEELCCQKTSLSFVDSIWEIFGPLLHGVPLVIFPDDVVRDVNLFVDVLSTSHVTRLVLVPSLLRPMLEAGNDLGEGLSRLKLWTCSGESLPLSLAKSFQQRMPAALLLNLYGSSEVAADVSYYEITGSEQLESIPLGWPIANTQLYVLDRSLQPVPVGVIGEIYVGGDNLARGYLERPELTAEKFVPNPFAAAPGVRLYRTGDRGRFLKNGALEFRGRTDYQVKMLGSRIELGEIESALENHEEIQESIVVAREDDSGETRLVAYIRRRNKTLSNSEIRAHLRRTLPEFMIPNSVVVLEDFPRTPSGKIDRVSLPEPVEVGGAYVAPRTLTEEIVASVMAEILKVEDVGANHDFFELGGHSLLIPRVTTRLHELFGVELPMRALFDYPRISELAEKITSLRGTSSAAAEIPLVRVSRDGPLPLTFAQESLWAIGQINPDTAAYNIPRALRLKGTLVVEALQASIDNIVSRHEVLRTIFPSQNGKAVSLINSELRVLLSIDDLSYLPEPGRDPELRRRVGEECRRPFNLAVGPLLRATLLRSAEHDHILIVTMHHIISDGWSMSVFFDELVSGYNKLVAGEEISVSAPAIQYADFAHWQRESLKGYKLDQSLLYWQQQLAGAPLVTDLPNSRERPAIRSFKGARYVFEIPADATAELKNLARAERVTLFMTLLGAFQTLLWTYSEDDDIVVGCPSAGRRSGTETLIGYFVNTLALRTNLSGNPTFRELIHRVAETTLGALMHEHLPFAKLVEKVQPERSLDHNPLFQVWFVLQAGERERKDFAGLTVEHYPIESEVTRHDLQLTIWESSSVLKAAFTYNTDILDSQTVEHMAEQLLLLLATVLKQPDTNSNDLRNLLQQRYEAYMESIEQERQQSIRRKFLSARRKSLAPTSSN